MASALCTASAPESAASEGGYPAGALRSEGGYPAGALESAASAMAAAQLAASCGVRVPPG